ncbi:MAG: hypothetical protein QM658_10050 [Gordonia sp. (in: high G+C Gram-positive bacteria)]
MSSSGALQAIGIVLGFFATQSSGAKDDIRRKLRDAGHTGDLDSAVATASIVAFAVIAVFGVIGIGIGIGLWIWMARSNAAGKSWARAVAKVLAVLGILFSAYSVFTTGGITIVSNVITIVLAAAILYFLYRPESIDYYEAVTARRS